MWVKYNPNPLGIKVGDCSVRAIAKAFGDTWDTAYAKLALEGYIQGDMPSSDAVWGSLLKRNGFKRYAIDKDANYNAGDFCTEHPKGLYVLAFGGHVAAVSDGNLFDSWDSTSEIPVYFYMKDESEENDGVQ